ncbi:pirin family protein [Nitrococcus mobilis]|uniref:Pirin domain protein n=1 Tax=Nitrococcus mobilis Nb-231 TaxID=314278 RepID=A4BQ26_9GAMM|nr:pirin family protein [Nitrococcus mobilis]EAR22181.1 pirin domain protein [Nitrococcus mobilis Nb-231]
MSWRPTQEPEVLPAGCPGLKAEIIPRPHDLGGFTVRRVLPAAQRQMIGPFIFFDHMGPAIFETGQGIDVRSHPHLGLATVTYLFEGELLYRDSLGSVQTIRPGEVNWMSAGRARVPPASSPGLPCPMRQKRVSRRSRTMAQRNSQRAKKARAFGSASPPGPSTASVPR